LIGGYKRIEQDYRDAVELIELGEAEDDESVVREAGARKPAFGRSRRQ
jgi:hypothetical protein